MHTTHILGTVLHLCDCVCRLYQVSVALPEENNESMTSVHLHNQQLRKHGDFEIMHLVLYLETKTWKCYKKKVYFTKQGISSLPHEKFPKGKAFYLFLYHAPPPRPTPPSCPTTTPHPHTPPQPLLREHYTLPLQDLFIQTPFQLELEDSTTVQLLHETCSFS